MGTHPRGKEEFDWKRHDCDIWMFNETPNLKDEEGKLIYPRADVTFQLHHEAIWKNPKNRSDEEHYKWITTEKTTDVYMQKAYKEVPMAKKYPIDEIFSMLGNIKNNINGEERDFRYITSSPEFALALVANLWKKGKKYKKVEIWGIELETDTEYVYQRLGFGFWVGYLTALGIEMDIHSAMFEAPTYGYEGDIILTPKVIEKRIAELEKELGDKRDKYNREAEDFLSSLSNLLTQDTSTDVKAKIKDLTMLGQEAGIINGKIKENKRYLEKAVAMREISGSSIFSPGEFDSMRIYYNKQYVQVRAEALAINTHIEPQLSKVLLMKKKTQKRKRAIDELGKMLAELMNKNMLLYHVYGAIQENYYYHNSSKISIRMAEDKK